jgi:hypothetical protein
MTISRGGPGPICYECENETKHICNCLIEARSIESFQKSLLDFAACGESTAFA